MSTEHPHGSGVTVRLTRDDAHALAAALIDYFDQPEPDPAWHHHTDDGVTFEIVED